MFYLADPTLFIGKKNQDGAPQDEVMIMVY